MDSTLSPIFTSSMLSQSQNVSSAIFVTPCGISMDSRFLQYRKAPVPRTSRCSGSTTLFKLLQLLNE